MSNEAERQLRDTSDAVMRDLEALSALEEEKRALHPGDPRLLDFATRIRSLADRLLKVSADEQARVLSVERGEEAPPTQSIEQTPPRSIQLILAEWRDGWYEKACWGRVSASRAGPIRSWPLRRSARRPRAALQPSDV